MPYCKQGEKATVVYSFNGKERKYVTESTPIEVATYTKRVNASNSYNPEGFGIRYYSPNNRRWVEYPIRDYIIFPSDSAQYYPDENYAGISIWDCNSLDFNRNTEGRLSGSGINTATLTILPNLKCPTPLTNKCSIEVKHKGIIIFQDQGDCPVGFSVVCGDCPEGTIKCNAPGYPGYCCLPCKQIAGEIKAIASQVRRINNV